MQALARHNLSFTKTTVAYWADASDLIQHGCVMPPLKMTTKLSDARSECCSYTACIPQPRVSERVAWQHSLHAMHAELLLRSQGASGFMRSSQQECPPCSPTHSKSRRIH